MTLGQNICRLRTERGLSQGDLADALGVSRQSISKWETDASVPELEKLRRLSELFHISLDALVGGFEPFRLPEGGPPLVGTAAGRGLGRLPGGSGPALRSGPAGALPNQHQCLAGRRVPPGLL